MQPFQDQLSQSGTYPSQDAAQRARPAQADRRPLVLDLDGTLLRTDLLVEHIVAALARRPWLIVAVIWWYAQGPAVLKRKLAERAPLDVEALPLREDLAAYVLAEREAGREIVLATATDEMMARRIARRVGFIDTVIASDGRTNLKGAAKARALAGRYPQGFVYAGDSAADLAVWRAASGVILVNAPPAVARAARRIAEPVAEFAPARRGWKLLSRAMRLKQWAKNALVFAPVLLAGRLLDPAAWGLAFAAFLALGFVASATYIVNDLIDLPQDRRHWSKRARPLASGELPIGVGVALGGSLLFAGLSIAAAMGPGVAAVVFAYLVGTLAYSFRLKRVPILDVGMLASLFTLRLFLGVVAIGAVISPWLFVFSMALFLSLSIAKRHTEVVRMRAHGETKTAGRGYLSSDEPMLLAFGAVATGGALVLLVMYLMAEAFRAGFYSFPSALWAMPVVLFLWLGRIWLLCGRGELDDDPVAFALRDAPSRLLGLAMGAVFAFATFGGAVL